MTEYEWWLEYQRKLNEVPGPWTLGVWFVALAVIPVLAAVTVILFVAVTP